MSEADDNFEDSILPEAKSTYDKISDYLDENPTQRNNRDFGHSLGLLSYAILGNTDLDPEKQREILKRDAEELIRKFGPKIVDFLKPELREALGITINQDNNS